MESRELPSFAGENKSLRGEKESEVERVEHGPGTARGELDPARSPILHMRLPWAETRRGAGYDANGNIPFWPYHDFSRSLYLSTFFAIARHRCRVRGKMKYVRDPPAGVDLQYSRDYASQQNPSLQSTKKNMTGQFVNNTKTNPQ